MNINEQVKELRDLADNVDYKIYRWNDYMRALNEAADTIESLSAKLQAASNRNDAAIDLSEIIVDFEDKLECAKIQLEMVNDYADKDSLSVKNDILFFGERVERYEEFLESLKSCERPDARLDNEWIYCDKRMLSIAEYMELVTPYMKRIEIAYMTDTVEYLIGYYDGGKWLDKHHNIIKNVIAWRAFIPLSDKHYES